MRYFSFFPTEMEESNLNKKKKQSSENKKNMKYRSELKGVTPFLILSYSEV